MQVDFLSIHRVIALLPLFLFQHWILAQPDSLFLEGGDILVGEMKDLSRGVITLETGYSDSDFKIEWTGVRMVRTTSHYLVQLTHGERITARLYSMDQSTLVLQGSDDTVRTNVSEVVFLKSVKEDFWSRASASVDFGYSFTKANALQQFSIRSSLGYATDRWSASATYNRVNSTQNDVDDIQRTDLGAGFRWALPKNFYGGFDASFLANTEQKLFLRSSYQPTVGNYLIRTNSMYLLLLGGAAYTREVYSTEDPERNTAEAIAGMELNLFDVGDLSLFISAKLFPGLSGSGRLRMDDRVDLKYDLPKDLYIRMGLTLNYDNQPVEGATDTDYVFQTTLGWEL
ncbi:MAG: DUF481 domain-containing protein [Flavobacteriales bacterium]|nr:DUF481 domain-containing protein [Flavobacteriales bacterium]